MSSIFDQCYYLDNDNGGLVTLQYTIIAGIKSDQAKGEKDSIVNSIHSLFVAAVCFRCLSGIKTDQGI